MLLESDPLPLIVMTPKSLLRHPLVACSLRDLAKGSWQPVMDDERAQARPNKIRRVFLCSGKMFVDLVTSDYRDEHTEVAIVRLEQLYPFPDQDLAPLLEQLSEGRGIGVGAGRASQYGRVVVRQLHTWKRSARGAGACVTWAARVSSSPAEGSSAWHAENQERLIAQAFDPGPDPIDDDFVVS